MAGVELVDPWCDEGAIDPWAQASSTSVHTRSKAADQSNAVLAHDPWHVQDAVDPWDRASARLEVPERPAKGKGKSSRSKGKGKRREVSEVANPTVSDERVGLSLVDRDAQDPWHSAAAADPWTSASGRANSSSRHEGSGRGRGSGKDAGRGKGKANRATKERSLISASVGEERDSGLEDLRAKVNRLREERAALRGENGALREENAQLRNKLTQFCPEAAAATPLTPLLEHSGFTDDIVESIYSNPAEAMFVFLFVIAFITGVTRIFLGRGPFVGMSILGLVVMAAFYCVVYEIVPEPRLTSYLPVRIIVWGSIFLLTALVWTYRF